jgi:hypothetical protein
MSMAQGNINKNVEFNLQNFNYNCLEVRKILYLLNVFQYTLDIP